jgi:hypothetical protein
MPNLVAFKKKGSKKQQFYSEAANRKKTDHTMAKRKSAKGQTIMYIA